MGTVVVEVTKPLRWDGEAVRPGQTLKLMPAEAQQIVDSGRGKLVHAADQRLLADATRAEIRAALKAERANWQPPQVDGPWSRM